MSFLSKFFQTRENELQYARQEGAKESQQAVLSELGYLIGTRKLLRAAPNKLPEKWLRAFELLLPGTDAGAFAELDVKQELIKMGFRDAEAQALLNQRKRPEALVAQLVAVLSGLPEEKTWGLVRGG